MRTVRCTFSTKSSGLAPDECVPSLWTLLEHSAASRFFSTTAFSKRLCSTLRKDSARFSSLECRNYFDDTTCLHTTSISLRLLQDLDRSRVSESGSRP